MNDDAAVMACNYIVIKTGLLTFLFCISQYQYIYQQHQYSRQVNNSLSL